ncbi:SIS domain-containing protein [Streptomyces sp. NPDC059010]|uniref:SIS domain-containing protein n=1 Tax=Streptomyces sp. NPDC059010 TaxID=3346695 RepID=UPI00367A6ABC
MHNTASDLPQAPAATPTTQVALRYLNELKEQAELADPLKIAAFADAVVETLVTGGRIHLAGNGGSASTAAHMACDWQAACARAGLTGTGVVNLADGPATLTALANDIAYEEVFARQLELAARPGDLLVLLSVGGNSPNLVRAAETARGIGVPVAALLSGHGVLGHLCDLRVDLGNGDYGLAEDLHLAVNHVVVRALCGGLPRRVTSNRSMHGDGSVLQAVGHG